MQTFTNCIYKLILKEIVLLLGIGVLAGGGGYDWYLLYVVLVLGSWPQCLRKKLLGHNKKIHVKDVIIKSWQHNEVFGSIVSIEMAYVSFDLINIQMFHFDPINFLKKLRSRPQNKYHHTLTRVRLYPNFYCSSFVSPWDRENLSFFIYIYT